MRSVQHFLSVLTFFSVSVCALHSHSPAMAQDLSRYAKAIFDARVNGEINPQHYRILPIAIPNALTSQDLPVELSFLLNQMTVESDVATFDSGKPLPQIISQYASSVIVGKRKLTTSESANLKAAEALLRDANSNPTPGYEKYQRYEKKDAELRLKLTSATSNEEISLLKAEIAENDEGWQLFGRKGEIQAALGIVLLYSNQAALDSRSSWQKLIQGGAMVDTSDYYPSLADLQGATRIRVERKPKIENLIVTCASASGDSLQVTISRVEFDAIRIPVPNRVFSHRFLTLDMWKHGEDLLLADGQGGGLVPYVPQELVVLSGLQIEFSDKGNWDRFALFMKDVDDLSIDGFVVKAAGRTDVTAFPGSLRWNSPQIVGVIAGKLKKTPSPALNLSWEN